MMYDPKNWYWSGTPGIYSSATGRLITEPNAAYDAWKTANKATVWPSDTAGGQTTSALDDTLVTAGLPPTGLTPPTKPQLLTYTNGKVQALLATSRPYTVAGVAKAISCDADQSEADVSQALQWGSASPAPSNMLPWIDNNYAVFNLTASEAVAFANAVGAYKISVFAVSAPAVAQIATGTIATTAQIDALAWPN